MNDAIYERQNSKQLKDQVEKLRETLSQVNKAFLQELRNEDEALGGSPAPSEVFPLNSLMEASSQDML